MRIVENPWALREGNFLRIPILVSGQAKKESFTLIATVFKVRTVRVAGCWSLHKSGRAESGIFL